MVYLPPEKPKLKPVCLLFEYWDRSFKLAKWEIGEIAKSLEIGGMACPVLYWKTLKHVSKLLCQTQFKNIFNNTSRNKY